jgi:hypothetical protein
VKFPVLVSYAYARKKLDAFKRLADRPHVKLLLDSGAFTAKNAGEEIRLDDYCRFLDEWKNKIFRYLALDVVGNPKATDANLQEMLRAGYKPAPVHVLGDDQRRMDELFEMSDYVALAGLRRPGKGGAPKEYVAAKMKWAAGRNVHWLGYVREPMIAAFRPYSCDSASWAGVHMYGNMMVYLGKGRWVSGTYRQRSRLASNRGVQAVLGSLGYTTDMLNDPNCWKRSKAQGYGDELFVSMAVTADSWVRYVVDIKKRYSTRIFLATIMAGSHEETLLNGAIDRHADKLHLDPLSV